MRAMPWTGWRSVVRWNAPRATCGWPSARTTCGWRWARSNPTRARASRSSRRSTRWTARCRILSRRWKARPNARSRSNSATAGRWNWPSGWRPGATTAWRRRPPRPRRQTPVGKVRAMAGTMAGTMESRRRYPCHWARRLCAGSRCSRTPCNCIARRCPSHRSSRASARASRAPGFSPRPRCP
ncbi:hypothetical protein D3C72_1572660 [compost metagenome]